MTVAELRQRMTSVEYIQWAARAKHEPVTLGQRFDAYYLRIVLLLARLCNQMRGQGTPPVRLDDFKLEWWPQPRQTAETLKAKMVEYFRQYELHRIAKEKRHGKG